MKHDNKKTLMREVDAFLEATKDCRRNGCLFTLAEVYHAARIGYRAGKKENAKATP